MFLYLLETLDDFELYRKNHDGERIHIDIMLDRLTKMPKISVKRFGKFSKDSDHLSAEYVLKLYCCTNRTDETDQI
jgi:hypothetical protein